MDSESSIILSIIIPVSRGFNIKKLLDGLSKQTLDLNKIEVILIYDRQETQHFSCPFNIQILFSNRNHPGVKRNIGCRAARGQYYVFLDDDCYPPGHWLTTGYDLLKKYEVICGPCNTIEKSFSVRLSRAIVSSFLGSGSSIYSNYREMEVPFYNVGFGNVFMHAYIWKMVGGCNEQANYLMDDKELFYLLSLRKIKFYNSPKIEVSHSARKFPLEFFKNCFERKFHTGVNFFIYNNIFRKQPIFYIIYASYFIIPLLLIFSPKFVLTLTIFYYFLCLVAYLLYFKKDYKLYFCLPFSVIITNVVELIGVLCGSIYFLFNREDFEYEIIAKQERIAKVLGET